MSAGTPHPGRRGLTGALACAALFLGSFGDEAAQVTFALGLTERSSPAAISVLLASGLVGAVAAGPCAPTLLSLMRGRTLITVIFLTEGVAIAAAGLSATFASYVLTAFVLGFLGSLLWSAVMVLLPALGEREKDLSRINRAVQTVRNLGYVVGPALGGILYAGASGPSALWYIGGLMLLAALSGGTALRRLTAGRDGGPGTARRSGGGGFTNLSLTGLLRLPGMARAVAPLVVTVLTTSMLNVLLILFVREELGYGAEQYGFIIATLSVGLVLGPLLLAGWFERFGEPAGAALAATAIGGALVAMGAGARFWWLAGAALVAGLANGVQNTLMSTYVMKVVPADKREQYMPAYVLILQSCVLTGFLAAGLFQVQQSATVLFTAGCVAGAAGVTGAVMNRGVRASSPVERDEEAHVTRD
ncbi:MFS transporter [Streptomyces sp. SP18CS02]|uniref:MFS transporter n=1 Tax=Streptomyces sp. SP18CS02 TaxID=3002531 RepID=UPI002E7A6097|nr:MFS transporter [Streptomyces sp. SP18CS02]MEE1751537.1 MFS transporter [Streptomyces sp. SP18CS02]